MTSVPTPERLHNPEEGSVHIIGGGLSGLASAVRLVQAGCQPVIYESTDHAGGRCRSLFEPTLNRLIDNGNHLLLSGNHATMDYLKIIGAREELAVAPRAVYTFVDIRDGKRWSVRPNRGRFPWWVLSESRRVPDSRPWDYFAALGLSRVKHGKTVAEYFDTDRKIFERFWEPLAVAVLNAGAHEGAACLLWPVIQRTFGKGEAACRPCFPCHSLSGTFVDPALAWLSVNGAEVNFQHRIRGFKRRSDTNGSTITELDFANASIPILNKDRVILAVPPDSASSLLPDIPVPSNSRAIVNVHFLLPHPPPEDARKTRLMGIIGGHAQWLFLREDVASATVSAADKVALEQAETIAQRIWPEVVSALGMGKESPLSPYRVIKEKRATFAQIPDQLPLRAKTRTAYNNLFLAGDWTDTGLPATIEGAVKSGFAAAEAVLEDKEKSRRNGLWP